MRVLVTGAQGCIGAWVVKALSQRKIDVVMFDRTADVSRLELVAGEGAARHAVVATGSIEDGPALAALVRDSGITHIVHLAAVLMPFCQADPVAGAAINVIGTLNVFEAARRAGRPVRIAYASSSAVWGPEEVYSGAALSEDEPLHPTTHYGVFKQANEANARVYHAAAGISSIGLRPWTVYGLGRDSGLTADPTLAMRAVARREPFRIRLTGHMDLQYAGDVAEAFVRCALSPLEGAHVFNLKGSVIRMDELIALLEQVRPGAGALISAEGPKVPVAYRMDDSALRAAVPGIPATPLEAGVRSTIEGFERAGGIGGIG